MKRFKNLGARLDLLATRCVFGFTLDNSHHRDGATGFTLYAGPLCLMVWVPKTITIVAPKGPVA